MAVAGEFVKENLGLEIDVARLQRYRIALVTSAALLLFCGDNDFFVARISNSFHRYLDVPVGGVARKRIHVPNV